MPVPVRVYNEDKTDSTDFRLVNTRNNQEFLVKVDFNVAELKIDPDYWLVSKTERIVSSPIYPSTNKIAVYPNPFTESFSVSLASGQELNTMQIYSAEGVLLKQYSGNKTNFFMPEISKGMYILRIETSNSVFETKIVKK